MRKRVRRPTISVPRVVPGPGPASFEPAAARPDPPRGARHLVVVVLDSLRHDSWLAARPAALTRLGPVERRWSYASWTAPSHFNLLMGLLPHTSPSHVYASEYYKRDFLKYAQRLNVEEMEFKALLPSLYLPTYLRNTLGYRTNAFVSMPVLNGHTPINRDFDHYQLMDAHNDMAAMVDLLHFDDDRPSFTLLNVGETHYPYATPDEDPSEWPRISGVHGVFKHLDEQIVGGQLEEQAEGFFEADALAELRDRQIRAVTYVDGVVERLFEVLPKGTWVVVTADHGELFGEDGYFGHGPVNHEKVFEVPFVEGVVR